MSKLNELRDRLSKVHFDSISQATLQKIEPEIETFDKKNPPHLDGIAEMSELIHLETDHILHNLAVRYDKSLIYTSMQSVLLAVNPYDDVPLYGSEKMQQYRGKSRAELMRMEPHCYRTCEMAYRSMARNHINQSILCCGESGSGKTESAKIFMGYLAHITGHSSQVKDGHTIEDRFLQVNPILEAFGNAQTLMNNNSSRFGKFTKVVFEKNVKKDKSFRPHIVGSEVETYLLEKSRVVKQLNGERNYHIFYSLMADTNTQRLKNLELFPENCPTIEDEDEEWVSRAATFHYMNQSGSYTIPGISEGKRLQKVMDAFKTLNFTLDEQEEIFCILASILHLGNVSFTAVNNDECKINDIQPIKVVAKLFKIDENELENRLVSRNIKVADKEIRKPLNFIDAMINRDAMAKSLYNGLFDFIVKRINNVLHPAKDASSQLFIGILDVFGFESSEWNNSFEQFCINYANERLQSFFNQRIMKSEQDEYMREGLPWLEIPLSDNDNVIELIEDRTRGVFALLNQACLMPQSSDKDFIANLLKEQRRNPIIKQARSRPKRANKKSGSIKDDKEQQLGFIFRHYAGKVYYNAKGFCAKNSDIVNQDTLKLFGNSNLNIVSQIMPKPVEEKEDRQHRRRRSSTVTFNSISSTFQKALSDLMQILTSTDAHFVRCINPNQFKMASTFDQDYIAPQLNYGGIVEAARILKLGFPSRTSYDSIWERFGHISTSLSKQENITDLQKKVFAEAVFLAYGLPKGSYRLGITKVFFRPGQREFLEDVLSASDNINPDLAKTINSLIALRRFARLKGGIVALSKMNLMIQHKRRRVKVESIFGTVGKIVSLVSYSLNKIKRTRAVSIIQAYVRARLKTDQINKTRNATMLLQTFTMHCLRRKSIFHGLKHQMSEKERKRLEAEALAQMEREREEQDRKAKASELRRKRALDKLRAQVRRTQKASERTQEQRQKARLWEEQREKRRKRKLEEAERVKKQKEKQKRIQEEQERAHREFQAEQRVLDRAQLDDSDDSDYIEDKESEPINVFQPGEAPPSVQPGEKAPKPGEKIINNNIPATIPSGNVSIADTTDTSISTTTTTSNVTAVSDTTSDSTITESTAGTKNYAIPSHVLAAHLAEKKQQQQQRAEEQSRRLRQILINGGKFVKYGRRGKPHIKHICVNVMGNLHWSDKEMDPRLLAPSDTCIRLKNVLHVIPGKETKIMKRSVAKNAPEFLCFSIVATERTLDLQAANVKERNLWIKAIESAVTDARSGMVDFLQGKTPENKGRLKRSMTLQPRQAEEMMKAMREPLSASLLHNFDSEEEMMSFLMHGGEFLRFQNKGKPMIVYVDATKDRLYWGQQPHPSTTKVHESAHVKDIVACTPGKTTGTFQYRSTDALSPPENCFSIIFSNFTIDLQMETTENRNKWVSAISILMDRAKYGASSALSPKKGSGNSKKKPIRRSATLRASKLSRRASMNNMKSNARQLPTNWTIEEEEEEKDEVV